MEKQKLTKFSDIVYYYKWYAIVFVVIVLMVLFMVRECGNIVKDDAVVTMLLSSEVPPEAAEEIANDLCGAKVFDDLTGDGVLSVYVNPITIPYETASEEAYNAAMQASLALTSEEGLLFFVDEDLLELYEENGFFTDISEKAIKLGKSGDDVYTDSEGKVIGISLKGNEYLEKKGINTETLYACFKVSSIQDTDKYMLMLKAAEDIFEYVTDVN